jgi:hypothetical protein
MAQAVIDEGKKGQLATVNLFEVAEVYPPSTDRSHATTDEDSLARTLLNRMGMPEEPIARAKRTNRRRLRRTIRVRCRRGRMRRRNLVRSRSLGKRRKSRWRCRCWDGFAR